METTTLGRLTVPQAGLFSSLWGWKECPGELEFLLDKFVCYQYVAIWLDSVLVSPLHIF